MHGWHALLAPLPADVVPERKPVSENPEHTAITGWESLLVHLTAGAAGLRTVQVTVDDRGDALSAGDTVLYAREEQRDGVTVTIFDSQSIGGRFWPDGRFEGTRWTSRTEQIEDEEAVPEMAPSTPTEDDVTALREIVADVVRRAPPAR